MSEVEYRRLFGLRSGGLFFPASASCLFFSASCPDLYLDFDLILLLFSQRSAGLRSADCVHGTRATC